jgi:fatty-acyl-CoA synthase
MLPSIAQRRSALRDRRPQWRPRTLIQALDEAASEWPDRPLVITDDGSLTYAEVAAQAHLLGLGLAALGVRPGDRVGLLIANYPEFVPLKFAVAAAGGIAVPLNYLYRREELAYVLAQSGCSVLISMTGFLELDYPAMLDDIAPNWAAGDGGEALPALKHVVLLSTDGRTREDVLDVAGLAELGRQHPGAAAESAVTPLDVSDILYTSGTTGSPKGVTLTHDAVLRTAYASALTRAFEDGRRILFSLPCYHMFAYIEGLMGAMEVGGAIIPQTKFEPLSYFAGIETHRATEILCVPTMTIALLEHPERAKWDLSSLFAMLSGAAAAPTWVYERARDELGVTEITTGYGMTECGGAMTMTRPEDDLSMHSTTVGAVKLAGSAGIDDMLCIYKVVDPNGDEVAQGAEGELISSGPTMMLGYWNKPEDTAAALKDGWVHSADLGRVREDGYIQLTGRTKDLYKSGGELVMPKEIEELLAGLPGVSQVYVVGVPDERWGEIGCAYVVLEPGSTQTVDALMTVCRAELARFKVPKHIVLIGADDLPKTPTGKIQKFRLVEQFVERQKACL